MKKISIFLMLMTTSLAFAQNIITNGDFESGNTGWSGNAVNVVTQSGNSFNEANVTAAGNPWDVNLSYVTPMTTSGKSYKLTFDAWSDRSRTIVAGIGLNQDPWDSVTQNVNLTTTSQTFVLTLTSTFANANSRIIFDMGAAAGYVGIDNVKLEEVTTTCNNGVMDGDETGIDCGGSCGACVVTPLTAAPTPPARAAADVFSLYSDAYTPITVDNFDTGWCGGTASTAVLIAGNNTLKKNTGKDCHGIDFQSFRKDLTAFTHLHFDFYITDTDLAGDVFNVKLVDFAGGGGEASSLQVNINGGTTPALVANQWVSVDVPITALGGVVAGSLTRSNAAQFVISNPNVSNVWYDNIYLHKNTVLGVSDANATVKVNVYPNPVKAGENIKISAKVKNVEVFNMNGQKVKSSTTQEVSTQGLNKGVYILKVTTDAGKTESTKVIVK